MSDIVIIAGLVCLTVIIVTFLISAFKAYAEIEKAKNSPYAKIFGGNNGNSVR